MYKRYYLNKKLSKNKNFNFNKQIEFFLEKKLLYLNY